MFSASDCGNCPTRAISTSANCSIERLLPNEERMCSVSVQAVVCDNVHGEQSNLTTVRLAGMQLL